MAMCTGIEPVIETWQASVITTLLTHLFIIYGGGKRTRTVTFQLARLNFYQLNYTPVFVLAMYMGIEPI